MVSSPWLISNVLGLFPLVYVLCSPHLLCGFNYRLLANGCQIYVSSSLYFASFWGNLTVVVLVQTTAMGHYIIFPLVFLSLYTATSELPET